MDWTKEITVKMMGMAMKAALKARDEVIKTFRDGLSSGVVGDSRLPPYRPSQKRRRDKAGLQTTTKDLQFSKTLVDSLQTLSIAQSEHAIEIQIGFTGQAYRRYDQRDSFSNDQLADYLSRQQIKDGQPLLRLSDADKTRIEEKHKVRIYDSSNR